MGGGSNGSNDGLLGKDGLVPQDSLGSIVGVLNGGRLDMGNWGRLVDDSGLSDRVGDGAQLGGDLGEGLSSDDSVSEVATKAVALDGCAVMLRGTDNVGGSSNGGNSRGNDASIGNSQKTSKNEEGLEKMVENFIKCVLLLHRSSPTVIQKFTYSLLLYLEFFLIFNFYFCDKRITKFIPKTVLKHWLLVSILLNLFKLFEFIPVTLNSFDANF